jgi:hypothetical protein
MENGISLLRMARQKSNVERNYTGKHLLKRASKSEFLKNQSRTTRIQNTIRKKTIKI